MSIVAVWSFWMLEEKCKGEGYDGWAVAGGESDIGFDHGAAKSVFAGRRSSLVLVRLAIGLLLPLAFGLLLPLGIGTARLTTTGVNGDVELPSSSIVGVIRSCEVSSRAAGVSRLVRRSITALWTIEYGRELRRMSRRC